MRQRIVIELEGEEPVLEELSCITRRTVTEKVLDYGMGEIRDFSIRREMLPEEIDGEIQVPGFLTRDTPFRQMQDDVEERSENKEVLQDG